MSVLSTTSRPIARRIFLLLAVVVTLCLAGIQIYKHFVDPDSGSDTASRSVRPTKSHVYALGRLEPAGTILRLAPQSGNEGAIVFKLFVREGDDVVAGATLAVLDSHARRLAAEQEAEARLEAAAAGLAQVRAGAKSGDIEAQQAVLRLAEEQSKVARRDLERAEELGQRKAITSEQLDQKRWEYDRLLLEQQRAAGILSSLREIRDVDVAVADREILVAKAALLRARTEVDAAELRAPADGRVLRIHTRPGERVGQLGILELGNVRRMQAVAEVFEADVADLVAGMPAEIRLDAAGDRLHGTVVDIGNMVARKIVLTNDPVSDTDARVVEVRIQLDPDCTERVQRLSNARVEVSISLKAESMNSTRAFPENSAINKPQLN